MSWIYLLIAALLEIGWAIGLKYTENWTRWLPSAVVIVAYMLCLVLLSLATRTIPASVAYSVWVGLGIVGVSVLDMVIFHEPFSLSRLSCILLILVGTVGLKLSSSH